MKEFVVTGIGTDVGKTVVSAIMVKAVGAAYWKPVQSGSKDGTDSERIRGLIPEVEIIPERYCLREPLSPHAAAELEGVTIELEQLRKPDYQGNLIIEGAGGLLVPLNQKGETFLDAAKLWNLPVVVVSRHYLGSINHTLLTIKAIEQSGLKLAGLIFVGEENIPTETIIEHISGAKVIGRIPEVSEVTSEFINAQARLIADHI